MVRPKKRHELKCWPEFFEPALRATKRFELRRDDRPEGFQVGDELLLREWEPIEGNRNPPFSDNAYTGREVLVRVDYVMPVETVNFLLGIWKILGNTPGFVIMSVSLVYVG